jgi:hypothetical protein
MRGFITLMFAWFCTIQGSEAAGCCAFGHSTLVPPVPPVVPPVPPVVPPPLPPVPPVPPLPPPVAAVDADALAAGIADRLATRMPPPPPAPGNSIPVDYPVHPRARWGAAWGLPVHQRLQAVIRGNDERVRATLKAIVRHAEAMRRIPARGPEELDTPRWINQWLPGLDGAALYAFVRERKPATYWEVGSGNSTRFVRQAINDGGLATRIVSIDPSPRVTIDRLCDEVIRAPLEEAAATLAQRIASGDVCFIDCSHRAFQNTDVTVAMVELLPVLPPDVVIGFHDIFLPDDYPPYWTDRYYNEQYLLAMFLLGGHAGMEVFLPSWDASRRPDMAAIVAEIWQDERFADVERHGDTFWLRSLER